MLSFLECRIAQRFSFGMMRFIGMINVKQTVKKPLLSPKSVISRQIVLPFLAELDKLGYFFIFLVKIS